MVLPALLALLTSPPPYVSCVDESGASVGVDSALGEARRLAARGASPTRNEEATYVYWIPHKSPEEAHTRETRTPGAREQTRAPARDSKLFGLPHRR